MVRACYLQVGISYITKRPSKGECVSEKMRVGEVRKKR